MGYESDQFFVPSGFDNGENPAISTGSGYGQKIETSENAPFSYPDNIIRGGYRANQSVLNEGTGEYDPVAGINYNLGTLKKGYIRNLQIGTDQTVTKCHFQFNPSSLNQSVSQNTQILTFLQQNPSQYAQPMPSNVNFQFQLMFDRSKELNNFSGKEAGGFNTGTVWASSDPSVVGVLHDIGKLYEAVGVGLSESQQGYMEGVLRDQIKGELLEQSEDGANDLQTAADVVDEINNRVDQAQSLLKNNQGNTGFLLPVPVRVVFSTLYIVEGLVQNISVRYVKFNRALVPMQATVEITLEGKYIGFAKKDTFFSAVLEERRKLQAEQIASQNKITIQNDELREVGEQDFASIKVEVKGQNNTTIGELVDEHSDLGIDREARLRMYPNRGGFRRVKGYWDSGNNLTVAFECVFEMYRIHKFFYDDNKNPQGKAAFEELPERTWDDDRFPTVEEQESAYEKALILKSHILDFTENTLSSLDALLKNPGYPISEDTINNDYVDTGKVWYFDGDDAAFPTTAWLRTSTSLPEDGKTSFTERDQIGSLSDDDSWIARSDNLKDNSQTVSGRTTGYPLTDENDQPFFPVASGFIDSGDVTVLGLFDLTITITDDEGSRAVGKARDYFKETQPRGQTSGWDSGKAERDMLVDWSGGN